MLYPASYAIIDIKSRHLCQTLSDKNVMRVKILLYNMS